MALSRLRDRLLAADNIGRKDDEFTSLSADNVGVLALASRSLLRSSASSLASMSLL